MVVINIFDFSKSISDTLSQQRREKAIINNIEKEYFICNIN